MSTSSDNILCMDNLRKLWTILQRSWDIWRQHLLNAVEYAAAEEDTNKEHEWANEHDLHDCIVQISSSQTLYVIINWLFNCLKQLWHLQPCATWFKHLFLDEISNLATTLILHRPQINDHILDLLLGYPLLNELLLENLPSLIELFPFTLFLFNLFVDHCLMIQQLLNQGGQLVVRVISLSIIDGLIPIHHATSLLSGI